MEAGTTTRPVSSLVLELGAGIAVIDGERAELRPKDFALLKELAEHPGEVISPAHLVERVWPELHGMTRDDLYWHVAQLRKAIGDDRRDHKLVANRRGYGYVLDLADDNVTLLQGRAPSELREEAVSREPPKTLLDDDHPVSLIELHDQEASVPTQPQPEPNELTDEDTRPVPLTEPFAEQAVPNAGTGRSWHGRRSLMALVAIALTSLAIVVALKSFDSRSRPQAGPKPLAHSNMTAPRHHHPGKTRAANHPTKRSTRHPRAPQGGVAPAAPAPKAETVTNQSGSRTGSRKAPKNHRTRTRAPATSPPPPAPTDFLYLLYNSKTDDHFVTTDQAVASQYQGKGYDGGAIARVYVSSVKGTKPISTNHGTAYIFTSSEPDTKPRVNAVTLWYSANDHGDFLYTTSSSQAHQSGWHASLVGYVRSSS